MKLKHLGKTILGITMSTLMILGLVSNVVHGKARDITTNPRTNNHLVAKAQTARLWYNNTTNLFENKGIYKLNEKGIVYQIMEVKDTSSTSEILGNNLYCLNAEEGDTWGGLIDGTSTNVETPVEYDKHYDLKISNDKDNNIAGLDSVMTKNNQTNIKKYYSEIVWLLDNFYIPNGSTHTKNEYLAKAGIKYGKVDRDTHDNTYYYEKTSNDKNVFNDETGNLYEKLKGIVWGKAGGYCCKDTEGNWMDVILPDELIEVVQQATLWYFTNSYDYLETNKDMDECTPWLLNGTTGETIASNGEIGVMYQEQASILYNYLIYSAKEHSDYVGKDLEGTVTIDRSKAKIVKNADNTYKVGPIKLSSTGIVNIKDIEVYDTTGTTKQTGYDVSSIATGTDIYIDKIPASTNGNVKIKVNYDANTTTQTLWTASSQTEQPLVELVRGNKAKEAEVVFTNENVFDLSLRKMIKQVKDSNGNTVTVINEDGKDATRTINVDTSTIPTTNTATYKHRKDPVVVKKGYKVIYEIKIYNEGDIDGYASKVVDQLPKGLESKLTVRDTITSSKGNIYEVESYTDNKLVLKIKSTSPTSLLAFGTDIDSDTLTLECEVTQTPDNKSKYYMTNIAYISEAKDSTGTEQVQDRKNTESMPRQNPFSENKITVDGLNTSDKDKVYHGGTNKSIFNETDNDRDYFAGYEDDDDFETVVLLAQRFDLSLRKFISAISEDSNIEEGEYLTDNGKIDGKYTRAPQVDTSKLKTGTEQTAIYNHPKDAVSVNKGDYVLYTIRVYNEGDLDGYASKITDYLPEYLNYIDGTFNKNNGWVYNSADRSVTTDKLKYVSGSTTNELKAYDRANDKLDYRDVQILCRVSDSAIINTNITNIAEIAEYQDKNGNVVNPDADSTSNNIKLPTDRPGYEGDRNGKNASDTYYPGQEDDDDFEKVKVEEVNFDLALRKFITNISGEDVTTRIPVVKFEDNKITYEHPKDVVKVVVGDTVTYTLRIFNEGKINGFAQTITDDIPEYLEYLPKNATNVAYRWKMYDKDGNETTEVKNAVKIVSDYTSKENGEKIMADSDGKITTNPNLLKAFDSSKEISQTNPSYVDLKVAFKVKDPNSSKYIIKNKAQISEDADERGNKVDDIDSIPDKWNEGEDDQDYENVSVQYFDLALLKYVSEVKVTEDGTTTTTKTGNKGDKNDIIPKVEIHRKKIKTTKVKFIYTIKVTNEGDIPGYAKEITDYIPKGLEFYEEDNKGWTKKENGVITTKLLSDKLLQPGKSATVKVTFRWKNNENNMGVKTNIAEISEDENEKGIPDRDSTPGNKKEGEDDIDDADVILSIKTGVTENVIKYVSGATIILLVLAGGVVLIKKFVL